MLSIRPFKTPTSEFFANVSFEINTFRSVSIVLQVSYFNHLVFEAKYFFRPEVGEAFPGTKVRQYQLLKHFLCLEHLFRFRSRRKSEAVEAGQANG